MPTGITIAVVLFSSREDVLVPATKITSLQARLELVRKVTVDTYGATAVGKGLLNEGEI